MADDKKEPAGPIVLKVLSKKDKYVFDGGGKTEKEFKASLEDLTKKQENGERINPPKAIPVDLVLQLENTSKENVAVYGNGIFCCEYSYVQVDWRGRDRELAEYRCDAGIHSSPEGRDHRAGKKLRDSGRIAVGWTKRHFATDLLDRRRRIHSHREIHSSRSEGRQGRRTQKRTGEDQRGGEVRKI